MDSIFSPETGLLTKQLVEKASRPKKKRTSVGLNQKAAQLFKRRRQRERRKRFVVHSLRRSAKIRAIGFGRRTVTRFKANRKRKRTARLFRRKRK